MDYFPNQTTPKGLTNPVDHLDFNTDYTPTGIEPVGSTYWDDANHTISTVLENGAILQHGFELYTYGTDEGNNFPEGSAVSVKGATGNRVAFELTDISDNESAINYIGLLTTPVDSGNRIATREGAVRNIKTNYTGTGVWGTTWADGNQIWVSSTPGVLTNVKPTSGRIIRVGTVTNVHSTQGVIELDRLIVPTLQEVTDAGAVTTDAVSILNTLEVKQDVTNALILGDVSGDTRGTNTVDIQSYRSASTQVASGSDSVLLGQQNTIAGNGVVLGVNNTSSSAMNEVVLGSNNTTTGFSFTGGICIGNDNNVSHPDIVVANNIITNGAGSVIMGDMTSPSGSVIAFGSGMASDGNNNVLFGKNIKSYGTDSIVIGSNSNVLNATSQFSIALGSSANANASFAGAFGIGAKAIATSSFAIGSYVNATSVNNVKIGTNTTNLNINNTGFSVNNDNALSKIHATGNMLVTNVSSLGSELVTNGTFTNSASGWTLGTGWSYVYGSVTKNINGTGTLSQAISITAGKYYYVTFSLVGSSTENQTLTVSVGGASSEVIYTQFVNYTYRGVFKAVNTNGIVFTPSNGSGITSIDNVSVKEITGGDIEAPLGNIFLGSTKKIDFGNGDVTITHSTGTLTLSDGDNLAFGTTTGTKIGTATTQKLGFYNATPIVRPSAYTQTYSTADKTHANFTSSDITGITSSTTGSALAEPSATYTQSEMQQNFRRLQDQHNLLKADLADAKQIINSLIDDLQALGFIG
jgi:hypothetical protein